MPKYAATTDVPVDRSRAQVEKTLARYGATAFGYYQQTTPPAAVIMFAVGGRNYKLYIPFPRQDDPALRQRASNQYGAAGDLKPGAYDQAVRQRWRAACLYILALLEAVDSGIMNFEQAFQSATVLPDGRTVGEVAAPEIATAYRDGQVPPLLLGGAMPQLPAGSR